jgi:hypothetical protein
VSETERAIKHFNMVVAQLKYLDGFTDHNGLKRYILERNAKNRRRLQASRIALVALTSKPSGSGDAGGSTMIALTKRTATAIRARSAGTQ